MSARRFSLCPQLWKLTQRSAQPPKFSSLCTHLQTRGLTLSHGLPTCTCLRKCTHRLKGDKRTEASRETSPSSQSQHPHVNHKNNKYPAALVAPLIFPRIFASLKLFSCRSLHYRLFKVIRAIMKLFWGSAIICL